MYFIICIISPKHVFFCCWANFMAAILLHFCTAFPACFHDLSPFIWIFLHALILFSMFLPGWMCWLVIRFLPILFQKLWISLRKIQLTDLHYFLYLSQLFAQMWGNLVGLGWLEKWWKWWKLGLEANGGKADRLAGQHFQTDGQTK